jgi:MSHA biogenesis protein MshJ
MKQQWQQYSDKYLQITAREQVLILLTGLVVICLITFHFFLDSKLTSNKTMLKSISQLERDNSTLALSIDEYLIALKQDPNIKVRESIVQYEAKLAQVDTQLLTLTTELINPVQMRYALLELLKVEKGVELLSFELMGAEPLLTQEKLVTDSLNSKPINTVNENSAAKLLAQNNLAAEAGSHRLKDQPESIGLNLYRHGIKIKLSGDYFALQRYLQQLEKLTWKFFWQEFNFEVKEHPVNELSIEIYSLGSKREFVGV